MLAKDPNRYIGHNIATVFLGGAAWTVTDVKVQTLPKLDESESDLDYSKCFDRFLRREGIFDLGTGPNLEDGACRLVFSRMRRSEAHHPDHYFNARFVENVSKECFFFCNCIRVRDKQTILHSGIILPYQVNDTGNSSTTRSSPLHADDEDASLDGKLSFIRECFPLYLGRLLYGYPMLDLSNTFELRLSLPKSSFSGSSASMIITKVKLTIKEVISCQIPLNSDFDLQEFTRTQILSEKSCHFLLTAQDSQQHWGRVSWVIPNELLDCVLPDLGPTFASDHLRRGYLIKALVSLRCDDNGSSSTFRALVPLMMSINDEGNGKSLMGVVNRKQQDLVFVDSAPMSPLALQKGNEFSARRLRNITTGLLKYYSCSLLYNDSVVTVTTISLSVNAITRTRKSKLKLQRQTIADCENAIVRTLSGLSVKPVAANLHLSRSPDLMLFTPLIASDVKLTENMYSFAQLKLKKVHIIPGMAFEEMFQLFVVCYKEVREPPILKKVTIKIIEKTVLPNDGDWILEEKTLVLKSDKLSRSSQVELEKVRVVDQGTEYEIPSLVMHCIIPAIEPTLYSASFHREYVFRVKVTIIYNGSTSKKLVYFIPAPVLIEPHKELFMDPPKYQPSITKLER